MKLTGKMKIISLIMVNLMALSYDANALGVVSDYLENDTMELIEGGSRLYETRIQNPTEEPLRVKLTYDSNFLELLEPEDEYTIPPKSNIAVKFNVMAKNAEPGKTYVVEYTVHQLSASGAGLPFLLKIGKNFKLKVMKNENLQANYASKYKALIPLAAMIFLLAAINGIFIKKQNKKTK